MRLQFPIYRWMNRASTLVRQVQWRDPLTQTWGLIGGLLIVGMLPHYGRGHAGGEKKNLATAAAIFSNSTETEETAWRPGVPFQPEHTVPSGIPGTNEPDLRAIAGKAAQQAGWRFVASPLRESLASVSSGISGITVTWSGTRGGDAGSLDYYYTHTRGQDAGMTADFIIGNGCRGKDGHIETTRHGSMILSGGGTEKGISICLVGNGQKPSPAQETALGELITCIEARTGTAALAMRQPRDSGLLAGKM